jgi:hypothetical protein
MSLAAAKATLKNTIQSALGGTTPTTTAEVADILADAIHAYVTSAQVNVPGLGLAAPNGPVSGESTSGSLT